jgi:hypothetical protein
MKSTNDSRPVRKTYLRVVATVSLGILAGCISVSKVTPTANGVYVVRGRAIAPWNSDKERKKALKVATEYCAKKQSQRVLLHNIDEKSRAFWTVEHATIVFECEP